MIRPVKWRRPRITTDASGLRAVTWDELTIVLDVNVNYDDINPVTD